MLLTRISFCMKKFFFLISFFLCLHNLLAQTTHTVSGTIKDSTGQVIIAANIWLITGRDTLHSTSNETGKFNFTNVPLSSFNLRISVLGHETWEKEFIFPQTTAHIDLPPITLSTKISTLKEVVVKAEQPQVLIKGDTIEYRADQYQVRQYALVEDLLKRLPGIEVDMDGNITAMGKRISSIRINGKVFLVPNITTLTRLLPANMIDKIQIIDDYGELARATGRKVGEPQQVLNLQTKTSLSKILQGQAIIGVGNDGKYNANITASNMGVYQLLSVSLNTNNTNVQEGTGSSTTGFLSYRGVYNHKHTLNSELQGGRTTNNVQSNSTVKMETSEGTLYSVNNSNHSSQSDNYTLATEVNLQLTAKDMLSITLNYNPERLTDNGTTSSIQSGLQRKDQVTISNLISQTQSLSPHLFASHQFKKSGRTLSLMFSPNYIWGNNDQETRDNLRYYNTDNTIAKDSLLHQLLHKSNNNTITTAQISWVEPLNDISSLELKYGVNYAVTDNKQETQWIDNDGKANFIDSLSNAYRYTTQHHQAELNYHRNKGKLDYTLGMTLHPSSLRSNIIDNDGKRTMMHSNRLLPVSRLQYKPSKSETIIFNYTGNVAFPALQQLQSIPDLTNPQFPVIGNPNLNSSVSHSLSANYRKAGLNTSYINFSGNYVQDKIVTNVVLVKDSFNTIKQETHFLNVDGSYGLSIRYGRSQRLADGKYNLFLDGNSAYNNNILYLENVRKKAPNLAITQSVKANMLRLWIELAGGVSYTYRRNVYILQENNVTNLSTWTFNMNGKVYFLKTFMLAADGNKQINSGYSSAVNTNPFMVNATLEKIFFKRKLTCRLQGFNLLDEKARSSQTVSGNTVTENRSNMIGRYFMLSLQFDLNAFKE